MNVILREYPSMRHRFRFASRSGRFEQTSIRRGRGRSAGVHRRKCLCTRAYLLANYLVRILTERGIRVATLTRSRSRWRGAGIMRNLTAMIPSARLGQHLKVLHQGEFLSIRFRSMQTRSNKVLQAEPF